MEREILNIFIGMMDNFTKYFATEDCMTCLFDSQGVFLTYNRSKTVDLKLKGTVLRKESHAWETLREGKPAAMKIPAGTYGPGTPAFIFFCYPIKFQGKVIGATGVTIDMTNNELLPSLVAGIEEMRAASEEFISTVTGMREKLDMVSQATENSNKRFMMLIEALKDLNEIYTVIDEVSDDIHILSLNAQIEAARAGEHGRGFNVIAKEIIKVNEKTIAANKQSEKLIKKVKAGLDENAISLRMLRQVQDDMFSYNDTLSSMYEELSAQIESLNNSVSLINVGVEV